MPVHKDDIRSTRIPSSLRLLLVIEELGRAGAPTTPTEVARVLGLPKATIHRLFGTLQSEGFIQKCLDGHSFSLGHRMRTISANVLSSLQIQTARRAILTELVGRIGETCNIAGPGETGMIYLERVESKWPMQIKLPIGTKVPLHCTASGKLYLSSLPEEQRNQLLGAISLERKAPNTIVDIHRLKGQIDKIRSARYAIDNEEFIEGMIAIAVPINDDQGRLMCTLAVHGPASRLTRDRAKELLVPIRDAARGFSGMFVDLGG